MREEIEDSEFTITLVSHHCTDFFPQNNAFNFSNMLYKLIELPEKYEVAVSEIFFKEKEKDSPSTSNEKKEKYFAQRADDNVLTLTKTLSYYYQIPKTFSSLNTFLAKIQANLQELNPKLFSITYLYNGDVIEKTTIKIIDPTEEMSFIITPPIMAEMLGFETNTFKSGTHTSVRPVDRDVWEEIPMNTIMKFEFVRAIQEKLEVEEPSVHDVEMLMLECTTSLLLSTYGVDISYDIHSTILQVLFHDTNLSIKFPPAVNEALGLHESYEFNNNVTIFNVGENLRRMNESMIQFHPGQQVLIQSSNIEGQIFGSKCINLLRIFPRKWLKEMQHIAITSLYYQPLNGLHLSKFHIKLTTENLKPLFPSELPTTVVLKLRPKG